MSSVGEVQLSQKYVEDQVEQWLQQSYSPGYSDIQS